MFRPAKTAYDATATAWPVWSKRQHIDQINSKEQQQYKGSDQPFSSCTRKE